MNIIREAVFFELRVSFSPDKADLSEGKRKHATSVQALRSWPSVAYNAPLPQKGVPAEVCQGSAGLALSEKEKAGKMHYLEVAQAVAGGRFALNVEGEVRRVQIICSFLYAPRGV
jgi:hypothetical protein